MLLAGESNAWVNDDADIDESLSFSTLVVHYHPDTEKGFYLRAGIGVSIYENIVEDVLGTNVYSSAAGAWTFGIGYDIRVGRNFSLTPFGHVFGTGEGEMQVNGGSTGSKFSNNVLQFGLGFTWH